MQKLNLLIIVLCILIFNKGKLMAYEEPDYKVLSEFEEFEIREYAPYLVAETEVDSSFEEASNVGFRLLFKYISGENQKQEKIEMTIPVNQSNSENSGEKIDMTTPVSQKVNLKSDGKYMVSFVIPSKYDLTNVPIPKDSRVKIREIPKRIMAVVEYSGTWSEENYRENEKLLIDELEKNNIKMINDPEYARYDPPFWPWFLRRNEVLIEIEYSQSEK